MLISSWLVTDCCWGLAASILVVTVFGYRDGLLTALRLPKQFTSPLGTLVGQ